RPYLFDGTLGDNLLMPLKIKPQAVRWDPQSRDRKAVEALSSGNSYDPLDVDWVDPGLAELDDPEQIRAWWFQLVEAMGIDEAMFRRTLRSRFDPELHPDLARAIVDLRPEIEKALDEKGLADAVFRFDPGSFNPAIPLGGNLFYGTPTREISQDG
ncbi:MAG: ABC transporter ATP-binding protein, partial [Sedimentitalea sp.]|nr:ABC transporter ATP-binding protein [Sedimentitalea sp.]